MIVEEELVLGTSLGESLCHFHSRLVVTVHEIHFPTLDTHLGVFLAGFSQVFVEHIEYGP